MRAGVRVSVPVAVLLSVAAVVACRRQPEQASTTPAAGTAVGENWSTIRGPLVEDYLKAHPVFAVVAGRHESDGALPDWSAAGIAAEISRLHAARDRAAAVAEATLSGPERFERNYFIARMDRDLFWLETAEAPFLNPAFYLDWMVDNLDPSPYLTRSYAPLDTRMRAYTYTMGKLMIRKLRDDWSATRGGRQAWRDFHDRFLTYGGPPIPMVRQQMMEGAGGSLF